MYIKFCPNWVVMCLLRLRVLGIYIWTMQLKKQLEENNLMEESNAEENFAIFVNSGKFAKV